MPVSSRYRLEAWATRYRLEAWATRYRLEACATRYRLEACATAFRNRNYLSVNIFTHTGIGTFATFPVGDKSPVSASMQNTTTVPVP